MPPRPKLRVPPGCTLLRWGHQTFQVREIREGGWSKACDYMRHTRARVSGPPKPDPVIFIDIKWQIKGGFRAESTHVDDAPAECDECVNATRIMRM